MTPDAGRAADELADKASAVRRASRTLAHTSTARKNEALARIAEGIRRHEDAILEANERDCVRFVGRAGDGAMLDRLQLNGGRVRALAGDVERVAGLPDPVGEEFDATVRPNGLRICRRRVPLGVIGVVYEARPNVTSDVAALCLKTGNGALLRGGSEASESNGAIVDAIQHGLTQAGLPASAVEIIRSPDRSIVERMLRLRGEIDAIVPRGGAGLIRFAVEHATVPVIETGAGVCHTYVDASADPDMATEIVHNAKVRRPTICNALDTLLVHERIAATWLPRLGARLAGAGVEIRADDRAAEILGAAGVRARQAAPDDWGQEFLALVAAVRVVGGLDEAIGHIDRYGSGHSEAIVTADEAAARRFVDEVDAAAVYVNASTQFTDGGEFGLGAEVGISTQKMHARGPMGLRELTSYKWVVLGTGQTRP